MCLNTYGQDTYVGKLIGMSSPIIDPDYPPVPCLMFGLETTSCKYVLSINSHWICGKLIVEGIEYFDNDEVEITGTITTKQDINSNEYIELEIETIKKSTSSNIETLSSDNNKVYFNATNQTIIIDTTLQNQSLTLELIDTQGKVILRKADAGNNPINIANLQNGVYLYRLLQNNQVICSDKIVK